MTNWIIPNWTIADKREFPLASFCARFRPSRYTDRRVNTGQERDRIVSSYARRLVLRELLSQHGPANQAHRTLATVQGNETHLREIEERIDALAAQLWGLTDKELTEIHRSLSELQTE